MICQSDGIQESKWSAQFAYDEVNNHVFGKKSFVHDCSGEDWNIWTQAGQQCRMYQYSFKIERDRVISLALSGVSLSKTLGGKDINLYLYIGDWLCANNRGLYTGSSGSEEPTASASCTVPLLAGKHTVTFMTTSRDSMINNSGYGLNASLTIH